MVETGSDEGRVRSWTRIILIPTLLAAVLGFLVSYAFTPKWTSQALILMRDDCLRGRKLKSSVLQKLLDEGFDFPFQ
jgi:hypothetical protein